MAPVCNICHSFDEKSQIRDSHKLLNLWDTLVGSVVSQVPPLMNGSWPSYHIYFIQWCLQTRHPSFSCSMPNHFLRSTLNINIFTKPSKVYFFLFKLPHHLLSYVVTFYLHFCVYEYLRPLDSLRVRALPPYLLLLSQDSGQYLAWEKLWFGREASEWSHLPSFTVTVTGYSAWVMDFISSRGAKVPWDVFSTVGHWNKMSLHC